MAFKFKFGFKSLDIWHAIQTNLVHKINNFSKLAIVKTKSVAIACFASPRSLHFSFHFTSVG